RTYFYIGGRESDEALPDLDRMLALLATQPHGPGDRVRSVEPAAEHNEHAWRAEFPRAVAWLFALPAAVH
ncbi:MAG: hypothetical protein ABJD97_12395, partial [Betaproteobacteria bacterium]